MINTIILGHAPIELKRLPSELVNCCVCSPPYWGLRDYCIDPVIWDGDKDCKHEWGNILKGKQTGRNDTNDPTSTNFGGWGNWDGGKNDKKGCFCLKCNAWRGSLGLEPTFELYIKHLCDIFDEVKRVLRKDGTCFVNMGDSYGGSGKAGSNPEYQNRHTEFGKPSTHSERFGMPTTKIDYPAKSLCLIPQRFAIEMVNRGWILRNTIIWHKKNCMPSSAKDRFTVDFEYVYFFTKNKKYCFEQQFEAWTDTNINDTKRAGKYIQYGGKHKGSKDNKGIVVGNPEQGRNKRAVWTIPTSPYPEAHFAVYPEALIEPMIKAGCPEFVCKKCGKARVKILDYSDKINAQWGERKSNPQKFRDKREMPQKIIKNVNVKEIGYTDCGCNAGWESGITLDPFMGAGTTALVALRQRKRFIGIEIKQGYIDMSYKRIAKVQQRIF